MRAALPSALPSWYRCKCMFHHHVGKLLLATRDMEVTVSLVTKSRLKSYAYLLYPPLIQLVFELLRSWEAVMVRFTKKKN